MFENLLRYPIQSPLLRWDGKMVVRDHEEGARLFLRIRLTGTEFPMFDSIPFVRAGRVKARFVDIADDGLTVKAYFDRALPSRSVIEFGFDDQVLLRFPGAYTSRRVERLDEERLPAVLRYQARFFERPR